MSFRNASLDNGMQQQLSTSAGDIEKYESLSEYMQLLRFFANEILFISIFTVPDCAQIDMQDNHEKHWASSE